MSPDGSAPRSEPRVADSAADSGDDSRAEHRRSRRRQWLAWSLLAVLVLGLLSLASGGLFLLAVVVVVGLLVAGLVLASTSVHALQLDRTVDETEVPCGAVVDARLKLSNRKPWPALWVLWGDRVEPGIDVEGASTAFDNVSSDGSTELAYRLHTTRRGLYRLGPALAEARDPFGLIRRFHLEARADFLTVLPRTLALCQGWPLGHKPIHQVPRRTSLFEDPTRFLGVRPYRPGDPLKRIHWRASARAGGELQVKQFEPAILDGALLAMEMATDAYPDAAVDDALGDPRVELAVTTAASLAEGILAANQEVALLSNGSDAAERYREDWQGGTFQRLDQVLDQAKVRRRLQTHRPLEVERGKGAHQRSRLRLALARLTLAEAPSLARTLHIELPRLPRSLVVLVVTPRLDGELAAVLGELRRSGFDLGVVWIGGGRRQAPPAAPEGIPVWPVSAEADLERLGSQRL